MRGQGRNRGTERLCNFYLKFAEAMALPLLTLGSSLLPGGSGRLLDMVTSLFSHGQ
jgi:hypothetical protein